MTEVAPEETLKSVDTEAIDALKALRGEQDVLEDRLARMEQQREKVSEEVYQRVQADYQSQFDAIEEKAQPLRQDASAQYRVLREAHEALDKALKDATLNSEEIKFRQSLGEFEEEDFKKRLKQAELAIKAQEKHLAAADKLRERFVDAFGSEEALQASAAEKSATADEKATQLAVDVSEMPTEDTGEHGAQTVATPIADAPRQAAAANQTMVLQQALLIVGKGEKKKRHAVSFLGSLIGSCEKAQIKLESAKIDVEHAEVAMLEDGRYEVRRRSHSGVIEVNGKTVEKSQMLEHGDALLVGDVTLNFHCASS